MRKFLTLMFFGLLVETSPAAAEVSPRALLAAGTEGTLSTADGVELRYWALVHPESTKSVVFLTGWAETYLRYHETLLDFYRAGYSVFTYDHRSQGLSSRLGEDADVTHVESFDEYVSDLDLFMESVVKRHPSEKRFLLTHSMGGLIGSMYSLAHPDVFAAQSFASPLFAFRTAGIPYPLAYGIVTLAVAAGQGKKPAVRQNTCRFESFETNRCTHSRSRYESFVALQSEVPESLTGRASNAWIKAGFDAAAATRRQARDMKVPTLLLQAGQDAMVKTEGQDVFCRMAKDCQKLVFPEAWHELLTEVDSIRSEAMNATLRFFASH